MTAVELIKSVERINKEFWKIGSDKRLHALIVFCHDEFNPHKVNTVKGFMNVIKEEINDDFIPDYTDSELDRVIAEIAEDEIPQVVYTCKGMTITI